MQPIGLNSCFALKFNTTHDINCSEFKFDSILYDQNLQSLEIYTANFDLFYSREEESRKQQSNAISPTCQEQQIFLAHFAPTKEHFTKKNYYIIQSFKHDDQSAVDRTVRT